MQSEACGTNGAPPPDVAEFAEGQLTVRFRLHPNGTDASTSDLHIERDAGAVMQVRPPPPAAAAAAAISPDLRADLATPPPHTTLHPHTPPPRGRTVPLLLPRHPQRARRRQRLVAGARSLHARGAAVVTRAAAPRCYLGGPNNTPLASRVGVGAAQDP